MDNQLVTDDDDTVYRDLKHCSGVLSQDNQPPLDKRGDNQGNQWWWMVMDFRRRQPALPSPVNFQGMDIQIVDSYSIYTVYKPPGCSPKK